MQGAGSRRPSRWLVVLLLPLLVSIAERSRAQGSPTGAAVSTVSGVYSAEQAQRGEETFANNCMGCHTSSDHASPKFRETWNGRPLFDLFQSISETMPEDFPGALSPKEYAQVVAYLLKLNGSPQGKVELPADASALRKIRIEIGSR
jgi:mono/diheme cytochrome c family protein